MNSGDAWAGKIAMNSGVMNFDGVTSRTGLFEMTNGTLNINKDFEIGTNDVVSGGIINNKSGLTLNTENVTAKIINEGTITGSSNITLSSDSLNSESAKINTNGKLTIVGNVINANGSADALKASQGIFVNDDSILSSSASAIGSELTNAGDVTLADGTLANAIKGSGSIVIDGDVISNSKISQNSLLINKDKSLTITADNVDSTIMNSGKLILQDGTLKKEISSPITGALMLAAPVVDNKTTVIDGDVI